MTMGALIILAVTGSLVVLKSGVMVLVVKIMGKGSVFRPAAIPATFGNKPASEER